MTTDQRLETLTEGLEEVLTREDVLFWLDHQKKINHYIGFEISGQPHIGSALKTMDHIRRFQKAGIDCSIWLADWHSWINDKLGGDKEAIGRVARGYFTDCFIAAAKVTNMDHSKIDFLLGSEEYHQQDAFWETLIDVSKHTTLARMQRSITIMGRKEGENLDFAKLIYPGMQVADIFFLNKPFAHAGMDQRKAHVVAREVATKMQYHGFKINGKKVPPVALHHHLVMGLQKPPVWPIPEGKISELRSSLKMSKSVHGSAVFLDDSPEEIKKKVGSGFCVEKDLTYNPILDWAEQLVFPFMNELKIERPQKFGGNVSYSSYTEMESDFAKGSLHPMDLKAGVSAALTHILAPARKYLSSEKVLEHKKEFEKLKVTR